MRFILWLYLLSLAGHTALPWSALPFRTTNIQVSSVALNEEFIATGLVRDGVRILEKRTNKVDSINIPEFGAKRRIYDVAWWRSWLLIASENGVSIWDARRKILVAHLNTEKLNFNVPGAYSLALRGSDLWIGGLGIVAQLNLDQKKVQSSWKIPGNSGRAQALLALGSSLFVGTEGRGVQVLDLGRGSWKSYDQFDGLPANQVTGLELVGTRVIVGTAQGMGRIELTTQSASIIDSNIVVTYMAQVNGTVLLSTLDGLWALDGSLLKFKRVEVQKNPELQGDLGVWGNELITGTDNQGVIRIAWPQSILEEKQPSILPQGILFTVHPKGLLEKDQIFVKVWYLERATAEISLEAIPGTSPEERLVRLPTDAVGFFLLEVGVNRGKDLIERKTFQIYRDRTPPVFEMEGIPEFTKDTQLKVRGRLLDRKSPTITVEPMGKKVKVDAEGNLEASIDLTPGQNSWEIVVRDVSGNEVRYPMQIHMDNKAPQLKWVGPDTVAAAQGNWKIPLVEPNVRNISLEPNKNALLASADSMILMTLQNLVPGENQFLLQVTDASGNSTKLPFKVYFLDERAQIVQSVSPKQAPEFITKIDTVYRCTTTVAAECEPVETSCVESLPVLQSPQIYLIRYKLHYGETLRSVAEKFYGNRELFIVIAEQNGILDPEEWYRLPVGKSIWIPIWQNMEYGRGKAEKLVQQYHQKVGK